MSVSELLLLQLLADISVYTQCISIGWSWTFKPSCQIYSDSFAANWPMASLWGSTEILWVAVIVRSLACSTAQLTPWLMMVISLQVTKTTTVSGTGDNKVTTVFTMTTTTSSTGAAGTQSDSSAIGPVSAFFMTISVPALIYYLALSCTKVCTYTLYYLVPKFVHTLYYLVPRFVLTLSTILI